MVKYFMIALFACLPVLAYGADPQPHCTASATPAADDGFFGYLYAVSVSCDHIANTLVIGASATPVDKTDNTGGDAGAVLCSNTATCSGTGRFACLRKGSYTLTVEGF